MKQSRSREVRDLIGGGAAASGDLTELGYLSTHLLKS
jgi:hypothetical protein